MMKTVKSLADSQLHEGEKLITYKFMVYNRATELKKKTFKKQELLSIEVVLGSERDKSTSRQSVNALATVNSRFSEMAAPNQTQTRSCCLSQSASEMTMALGP